MSVKIKYKGSTIASINTDSSKTLKTSGKYCEADIVVENVQDGGINPTGTKSITENGSYDVTNYAVASVNVPQAVPIDVSTDSGMTAVLTSANVGKAYRFTGTTGTYKNGDIYVVEAG